MGVRVDFKTDGIPALFLDFMHTTRQYYEMFVNQTVNPDAGF